MKRYMVFDVGGTGVKYTSVDEKGEILTPYKTFPSPSQKRSEEVFASFADVIGSEKDISGVAMAWPGPFDFKRGVSLMDGLGKYQSIYGMDIGEEIRKALGRNDLEVKYDHDVAAFLSGYVKDEGLAKGRVIALVMGTGAGSAFSVNGKCVGKEEEGVPDNGRIYNVPFRDSVVEDWLSSKGIARLSEKYFNRKMDGKTLFEKAEKGNEDALRLWQEFGEVITEGMMEFVSSFKPTDMVFGGMISKAWKYFGPVVEEGLNKAGVRVHVTYKSSKYVFSGLFRLLRGENE